MLFILTGHIWGIKHKEKSKMLHAIFTIQYLQKEVYFSSIVPLISGDAFWFGDYVAELSSVFSPQAV